MHLDIIELQSFYSTALGRLAVSTISSALDPIWLPMPQERLVGIGYTLPYLDNYAEKAERAFAFMPARQGATGWPHNGALSTALVYDEELPLPDSSVDRILLVHTLEFSESSAETLKEMWRVLSPNGQLIVVVPNRRGVWARMEHTPFGSGRPFSRGQLLQAFREANFTPGKIVDALHVPPTRWRWLQQSSGLFETLGNRLWPLLGGVVVGEAHKRLYQGLPVLKRTSRRVFVPVLNPQGTARQHKSAYDEPQAHT
ncbi:class I SAM-dependent methyltransferase [Pseudochrobactrum sp. MP213Fo]|uniref:class I SAM-dependent methyltransferase n=1 Tax=Pseudochrobactrum sp. MP213Fo TaxID=3022250 RepID=UPI003BA3A691